MANYASDATTFAGSSLADIIVNIEGTVSNGDDVVYGGGGNDVILADHHEMLGLPAGSTFDTALNIDLASVWSVDANEDVGDATTVPWTALLGTGTDGYDVYAVTIGAGETITLDLDHAGGGIGGPDWDTELRLFGSDQVEVASNDDNGGDPGSSSSYDSALTFTNDGPAATFYIRVEQFDDAPIDTDNAYLLNVSVTGHALGDPGTSDADQLYGGTGDDLLEGGGGNDQLYGGTDTDQLYGGDGDDTLYDEADGKSDFLYGGAGDDSYFVAANGGTTFLTDSDGTNDAIHAELSKPGWTIDLGSGNGFSTGATLIFDPDTIEAAYGGGGNDILTASYYGSFLAGNAGNDQLYGGDGDDSFSAGLGNDIVDGGYGYDVLLFDTASAGVKVNLLIETRQNTGEGLDTITGVEDLVGSAYNDTLIGCGCDNILQGGDGNDTLTGNDGYDVLDGGDGIDTVDYSREVGGGGGVIVDMEGTFLGFPLAADSFGAEDLLVSIENVIGTNLSDAMAGDCNANILDGRGGDDLLLAGEGGDTLLGGDGNDILGAGTDGATIDGGRGNDSLSYSYVDLAVTVDLMAGTAVTSDGTADILISIENVGGTLENDVLLGTNGANQMFGDEGDDLIEGRGGNDFLDGGDGDHDVVSYEHSGAQVTVNLGVVTVQGTGGAGNDTLSGFEDLTGSAYNDRLTGDANANIILGLDGNDTIDGGLGDDTLDGGLGTDTASYASVKAAVTVSLAIAGVQDTIGAGMDTLTGFENLAGSGLADILTGDDDANRLSGGNGNDILDGGLGANILDGGAGLDTASYLHAAAGVTVNLAISGSQDTIGAGSDQLVAIEAVAGSAFDDTLTGNDASNVLRGGDGDDLINGGLGRDTLAGDAGVDTVSYASGAAGVTVRLAITTAQDTVGAGIDTLSGFEHVIGTGFDDRLTGDAGANTLSGGNGDDTLAGGAGDDLLDGGAGSDTVSYAGVANATGGITVSLALAGAQATGGAGSDSFVSIENLTGSSFSDALTGSSAANVLMGGNGNDILIGGGGADTLTGGANNDIFRYLAPGDSAPAAADRITDFTGMDRLDVSAIDADSNAAGDQAFHFAAGGFTNAAGEYTLAYDAGTDTTTALFDTDGDAAADMTILFTGDVTALASHFVL